MEKINENISSNVKEKENIIEINKFESLSLNNETTKTYEEKNYK